MDTCRFSFSICAPDWTKWDGDRLNFQFISFKSRLIFEKYCQMRLAFLPLALHTSIILDVLKCSELAHLRVFIHYRQAFRLMLIVLCKRRERVGWALVQQCEQGYVLPDFNWCRTRSVVWQNKTLRRNELMLMTAVLKFDVNHFRSNMNRKR